VISEIIQKVEEEMTFMGQRAASGPAREKRFLAAVIAAASAIFSFGLGVSTELELKSLCDTTNGLAKNQKFIVAQLVELARETDKELNLAVDQIHWAFIHSNINQNVAPGPVA
jgi:2,4-dienoyl-CoA reductase-like NADH-dependent reductase (Old Yellow Enzyme family)